MTSAQPMHLEFLLENGQCSNNNDRINASAYTTEVGERANARIKPPPENRAGTRACPIYKHNENPGFVTWQRL